MSFNNNIKKPKLVESKLVNYYNNKIKAITLAAELEKEQINNVNNVNNVNNINNVIIPEITWRKKIFNNIIAFIKANYGFVLLLSLIIILLYIRYIEVTRRKQQLKDLHEKTKKTKNNKNNKYIYAGDNDNDNNSDSDYSDYNE